MRFAMVALMSRSRLLLVFALLSATSSRADARAHGGWQRATELARGLGPKKPKSVALRLLPPAIRARVIRGGIEVKETALEGVVVRLASSTDDLVASARLVHDTYVRRGIMQPERSGLRVTEQLAHPSTAVFLATRHEIPIGTISLALDSPHGLPMEKIYPDEIGTLRRAGRSVAEVGALALAVGERGQGIVHLLNKAMLEHGRERKVDDLVISVHPDAEDLYRASLLFQRMGPVKSYPGLERSALAAPLRLDLRTAKARFYEAYRGTRGFDAHQFYMVDGRPELHIAMSASYETARAAAGAGLLARQRAAQ